MDEIARAGTTILMAIVGVAILAVLVSSKANTTGVLGAFGAMFSNMLSAATGPVTGATAAPINSFGGGGLSLPGGLGGFNTSMASGF